MFSPSSRKSQIAIEYCYRFQEKNARSCVLWVHASTSARFHEAYETIARKLSLPGLENPNADILQLVHDWLSDERHYSWLMILDNIDDMETIFTALVETPSAASKQYVALST